MQRNQVLRGMAIGLFLLVSGCSTPGFLKFGSEEIPVEGPKNPVVQVLAMWQPANGAGLDQKQTRGFAGQVFFVTGESPTPAKVDGSVTVWVFDDQGTPEQQAKAIHKFEFPAETWKVHAHKTMLGMSYSVFIPYTRPGRHHANCTLRVRYTSRDGSYLDSEMVNVELDGTSSRSTEEKGHSAKPVSEPEESENSPIVQTSAVRKRRGAADNGHAENQVPDADFLAGLEAATRPAYRPLTDAERDRILRETRARLEHLNAGDEFEDLPPAGRERQPNRRRSPNPLAEEDDPADDSEGGDDYADRRPTRAVSARHILDDEYDDGYSDEDDVSERFTRRSAVRRSRNGRSESVRHVRRNPLDRDEPDAGMTPRRHPLSIPLSDRL